MTFLVERLAELRRYLAHLRELQPSVAPAAALDMDLARRNDVLFSLLMVSQLVIDIAGELSSRQQMPFDDYRGAITNLRRMPGFSPDVVAALEMLPGFRNALIHDYIRFNLDRAVAAVHALEPVEEFVRVASTFEAVD
jgi:uncharacterized protein YutE (UPF0331/DUF86 family)